MLVGSSSGGGSEGSALLGPAMYVHSSGPHDESGHWRKKVFVGGISRTCDVDVLVDHFSQFGRVIDARVQRDRETQRSRGFAFVTFDSEQTAMAALAYPKQLIMGRPCDVRPASHRGVQVSDGDIFETDRAALIASATQLRTAAAVQVEVEHAQTHPEVTVSPVASGRSIDQAPSATQGSSEPLSRGDLQQAATSEIPRLAIRRAASGGSVSGGPDTPFSSAETPVAPIVMSPLAGGRGGLPLRTAQDGAKRMPSMTLLPSTAELDEPAGTADDDSSHARPSHSSGPSPILTARPETQSMLSPPPHLSSSLRQLAIDESLPAAFHSQPAQQMLSSAATSTTLSTTPATGSGRAIGSDAGLTDGDDGFRAEDDGDEEEEESPPLVSFVTAPATQRRTSIPMLAFAAKGLGVTAPALMIGENRRDEEQSHLQTASEGVPLTTEDRQLSSGSRSYLSGALRMNSQTSQAHDPTIDLGIASMLRGLSGGRHASTGYRPAAAATSGPGNDDDDPLFMSDAMASSIPSIELRDSRGDAIRVVAAPDLASTSRSPPVVASTGTSNIMFSRPPNSTRTSSDPTRESTSVAGPGMWASSTREGDDDNVVPFLRDQGSSRVLRSARRP